MIAGLMVTIRVLIMSSWADSEDPLMDVKKFTEATETLSRCIHISMA